jgi:phosphate transport system permease protein
MANNRARKISGFLQEGICLIFSGIVMLILFLILYYIFLRGLGAINLTFLTSLPAPVGVPGGGIGNALIGSAIMVALATFIATFVGISAAIFLDQHPLSRLASITRSACRVLTGVPSLIKGLFIFTVLVLPTGKYSALAGALALSVVMIPFITLSAEEMLRTVSANWRDASYALGATRKQTVMMLILPTAAGGLIVAIMLAVALAAGQSAPVLLTALTSHYWLENLAQPTASLPVLVYTYGISPFADWQQQAWGAALVLVVIILAINVISQLSITIMNKRRGI